MNEQETQYEQAFWLVQASQYERWFFTEDAARAEIAYIKEHRPGQETKLYELIERT